MSAKRDETRTRRFEMLMEDARHGRWIKPLAYGSGAGRR